MSETSRVANWSTLASLANRDFCPWANRYVYWLKQPVGWFVIATVASLLVGTFLSPIGWTVAVGLIGVIGLGLGFPWIAVRAVQCEMTSGFDEVHERQSANLTLKVRNRLPLPIFGLLVEGYLSQYSMIEDHQETVAAPDVGLAAVPAWSTATYKLAIQPEYRGRYPVQSPRVACAFPFGIWKASYPLSRIQPLNVWPMIIPLNADFVVSGMKLAEIGKGNRPSSQGEFLGVREFRRGDSLRSIHWVQTARQDNLIVCERGGPQKQTIDLHLTTERGLGTLGEARENLAWRVRLVATMIDLFVSRHIPFRLFVDGKLASVSHGYDGKRCAWQRLADIPVDGFRTSCRSEDCQDSTFASQSGTRISVTASHVQEGDLPSNIVQVAVNQPLQSLRASSHESVSYIDLDQDIVRQLNLLLTEASRESRSA